MVVLAGGPGDEGLATMSEQLPQVERHVEAGRTLLCRPRPGVPLVFVEVQCGGGLLDEPTDWPGVAALATGLLTEGPVGTEPTAWHQRLDDQAARLHCRAAPDYWAIGASCLAEDLDTILAMLAEQIARPAMPRSQWARLRKTHRGQQREQWAQPARVLGPLASVQAMGYGHPLAHPPDESAFRRARYRWADQLGRGALTAVGPLYGLIGGDIDGQTGFDRLGALLEALPASRRPVPPVPSARPASQRVWLMDQPQMDQAYFALSAPAPVAGDADRVALRLANYLIGAGSFNSRLMRNVRERMGHTYGIGSHWPEHRLGGAYMIHSFTRADNLRAMLELIEQTLAEIAAEGFTDDELAIARGHGRGSLPLRLTHPQAVLNHHAEALRTGLGADAVQDDWDAIEQTDRCAVNAAARRLVDQDFHLAVIGPAATVRGQLTGRQPLAEIEFSTPPHRWPAP